MHQHMDDLIIELMHGKQMDKRTLFVCGAMHDFLSRSITEFTSESDGWKPQADFRNALKGACVVGAMSRDEERDSPQDVIERIITTLIGPTAEERTAARDKMFNAAVANIKAGKHTMPYDGPHGSMPLPFSTEELGHDGNPSAQDS